MSRMIPLALLALAALASTAEAKTKLVELRVEGDNQTLEKGTWYATGPERALRSKPGDGCVRDGRRTVAVPGPSPLSLAQSGSESRGNLRQVRVRRDEAGLFTCEIGSVLGRPFTDPDGFAGWSYYDDYVFGSAPADQVKLRNGDSILWVFSDFGSSPVNTGSSLELRGVPARTAGKFTARVVEHLFDGTTDPGPGASIQGAESYTDLGDGRYEIVVGRGVSTLRATRGLDIPSNRLEACSRQDLARCPKAHGRRIVGSDRADRLRGTAGFDVIRGRGGRDRINLRKGGEDRVNCGSGQDVVLVSTGDSDDRIRPNCERVRRS